MYVCKLVYDLLWYQVPFVGLVSIYLLHILFGSDSSFNYTTDCAGVVAFQSLLMANPFFNCHDDCVYCCMVAVHFFGRWRYVGPLNLDRVLLASADNFDF